MRLTFFKKRYSKKSQKNPYIWGPTHTALCYKTQCLRPNKSSSCTKHNFSYTLQTKPAYFHETLTFPSTWEHFPSVYVLNSKTIMLYNDVPDSRVSCQHVTTLNSWPAGSRSTIIELIKILQYAISKISSFPRQGIVHYGPVLRLWSWAKPGELSEREMLSRISYSIGQKSTYIHTYIYIHIYVHTHINTFYGSKSMLQRQQMLNKT